MAFRYLNLSIRANRALIHARGPKVSGGGGELRLSTGSSGVNLNVGIEEKQ